MPRRTLTRLGARWTRLRAGCGRGESASSLLELRRGGGGWGGSAVGKARRRLRIWDGTHHDVALALVHLATHTSTSSSHGEVGTNVGQVEDPAMTTARPGRSCRI